MMFSQLADLSIFEIKIQTIGKPCQCIYKKQQTIHEQAVQQIE